MFYLGLGGFAKKVRIVDGAFLQKLNDCVFKLMFPFTTFYNIYKAERENAPSGKLMLYAPLSVLFLVALLLLTVPRMIWENSRRGVVIQAVFHSNFLLFGLSLVASVYGDEATAVAAMMVTTVVTIYNIASVVVMEFYCSGGGMAAPKQLLGKLLQNPLLQGAILGLAFYFFQLKLPSYVAKPVSTISDMTTPLALFALGGSLRFDAIKKNLPLLVPGLIFKMIICPALFVTIGYWIGLRSVELFLILAIYATPVATCTYPMAESMGADGELAGQFVFISTVVSIGILFLWISLMSHIGLL